ncbi:hypothetical protein BH11ACT8_BH11ACT8_12260 [soil metagenome]
MPDFIRFYRVAAADHKDCPPGRGAAWSMDHAEAAERALRARLEAGEIPDVVLIAPERSTVEPCVEGGRILAPVHAWREALPWLHAPHAVGSLRATSFEPDTKHPSFEAAGSVVLTNARLCQLKVSAFLAPVADKLRDRYGVLVDVVPGTPVPAPDVQPGPPVVLRGILDAASCRNLWDDYLACTDDYPGSHPADVIPAPDELHDLVYQLLSVVADGIGLPVDGAQSALANYLEGVRFGEHIDADPEHARMLDRTVSVSIMLNRPGIDFHGGALVIDGERVDLEQGDAAVFTATTLHRVEPVTWGHRFVAVGFGEVAR